MISKSIWLSLVLFIFISCKSSTTDCEKEHVNNTNNSSAVQMGETLLNKYPSLWNIEGRDSPRWTYTYGLVSLAMLDLWKYTGEEKYYNYAKAYIDGLVKDDGTIDTYKKTDYNIDKINSGKVLFPLYKHTGETKYKIAIDTLRQQLREHPRTSVGGYWHKKRYPNQMWLDGLYMGAPFYVEYGKEFNEPEAFDDVTNWIVQMEKVARDEKTGLLYHGWDESKEQKWSNQETGLSQHFWGRGMGWYAMALVDVLDFIPADYNKRDTIIAVIQRYAKAIVKVQHPEKGVWYQVLDQGDRDGNYLEGSVSSMFSYFLLKAVDKGYLGEDFKKAAIKGFEGTVKHLCSKDEEGNLVITPVCAVAGLGGNPYRDGSYDYYINESQRDNDPKAVGPFIMAGIYYHKMMKN